MDKPTWKNTFNSDTHSMLWGNNFNNAQAGAAHAGYQYFTWNSLVYVTVDGMASGWNARELDAEIAPKPDEPPPMPHTPTVNTEHSIRADVALSYVPVILSQLDDTGRQMFADVLQAMRDGGYEDGIRDGKAAKQ